MFIGKGKEPAEKERLRIKKEGMTNRISPKRWEEKNSQHKHKISVWTTDEFFTGLGRKAKMPVSS